ncbi:hypothetical protein BDV12DRAFT_199083 [Aspergillus spectabilis]
MDNIGAQQMRFRCAIAAVNHEDRKIIHVYCQDTSGGIREVTCENGKWSGGTERDIIAHGILGTPIVAICNDVDQMTHVFYIGERNMVRHVCRQQDFSHHGEWRDGDLNHENIEVAPYSMMAACCMRGAGSGNDKQQMRLYVQMKDNHIQEYGCEENRGHDSGDKSGQRWRKMEKISRALPGTGMACTCSVRGRGKENCIRLFMQDQHNNIIDHCSRDGKNWENGNMSIKQALPRTDLAATSCGENDTRVFYIDRENHVREMIMEMQSGMFSNSERWAEGHFDQPCVSGSQVAAISWSGRGSGGGKGEDECNIRVYFQAGHDVTAISEWMYRGRWEEGRRSLPPA